VVAPSTKKPPKREQELQRRNEELQARLAEAEETLRAIREGEVDALVVSGAGGDQIFALVGADSIYRMIVETMKEAAFTVTFDETILFCNAQFCQFVKRPPEHVVGRPLLEFVAEDSRATAASLLTAAQEQSVKQRLVFQASDGEQLPAHISATLLSQPDGPSICVVASDLRELENSTELIQQLRRQRMALEITEEELRVQNEHLRAAQAELARSNRDLDAFAAVAGHDLQEPLRAVTGFLSLLREKYQGQLDEKGRDYIGHAIDGATRMSGLINDVLEYSRVGSSAKPRSWVDLAAVVRQVLADLRAAVEESQATVTVDALPRISADAGQMRQVFQNLIGNALKFRAEGRRPEIRLGARREAGQWVLQVQDNGIGIPLARQDRVFDIFSRLHSRAKYPGTGIGLAICKRIVERHAGRIWIESEEDEGTTVFFSVAELGT
jgi:PAS domain S-box-containing protein